MIDWNEAKDVRIHDLETRVQNAQDQLEKMRLRPASLPALKQQADAAGETLDIATLEARLVQEEARVKYLRAEEQAILANRSGRRGAAGTTLFSSEVGSVELDWVPQRPLPFAQWTGLAESDIITPAAATGVKAGPGFAHAPPGALPPPK